MVIRYKNITETKEMVVDKCVGYCVGVCMFERGSARVRVRACVCACREWGLEFGYTIYGPNTISTVSLSQSLAHVIFNILVLTF